MGSADRSRREKRKRRRKKRSRQPKTQHQLSLETRGLLKAIEAFINAGSWAESRQVVEAHRELLTDEADALLAQLIRSEKNVSVVHILKERHHLLARCRAEGIDAAYRGRLPGISLALGDVDPALVRRAFSVHSEQEFMQLLTEHPELMPVLEQMMHQAKYGDRVRNSGPEVGQRTIVGTPIEVPPRFREHINRLQLLPNTVEGIEQQIAIHEDILRNLSRDEAPFFWGATKNNLGIAYGERIRGDRAENLERAIVGIRDALVVRTRSQFPVDWAMTQHNLGNALCQRIRGDRAENLERAIAAYSAALEVYARYDLKAQWAETENNLANAYAERIRGDRAENLEQAIAAYQAALEVRKRNEFPVDWAITQNSLGNALRDRIRGDRAENLERAIAAFQASLAIITQADFPFDWAGTQNNLGTVLNERIRGDRAENLEQAIAAFTAALEVYTRDDFPLRWAATLRNLGYAYFQRIQGDRAENLEQAITAVTAVLEVFTRTDFPAEWAKTQNNLGGAYLERIRGERSVNLERAIAAFQAALEVRTRTDFPVDWVRTQSNLGNAYRERIRGGRMENLQRTITTFKAVVDGAQALGIKEYECSAASSLGELYYDRKQWSSAYAAFDTAITALEAMRTEYFTEEAKIHLAGQNALLYARTADTCLHLGRSREALERAEAGRGRLFLDQLGTDAFPAPTISSERRPLFEREVGLLNEFRGLEHAIRVAPDEDRRRQFVAQQREKRAELDELWAQLKPHAPDYVGLRQGDPVKYDQIQASMDDFRTTSALVEFYTMLNKIIVFVLRSGEQEPEVVQIPLSQNQLLRYMRTYWRETMEYPQRGNIGQRWQELAEPLLKEVLPHLDGAGLLYLVPHGMMHYLSLHALRVDGEYLIDRFPIAYAPSAAVLSRVIQRKAGPEQVHGYRALVLGYTPKEHEREVFEGEAVQVAEFFGTKAHLGREATWALLREKGAEYQIIHLSCHGFFHPTNPLASGLLLADGVLTARDIMGMRLNAGLVTLSACQTALSEQQPGDELVGLTRALLYAGASSVLVTLWSVNAVAALELMTDFYRRLQCKGGGKAPPKAVALREAMLELRTVKDHPYYWAPFILVGDWR